MTYHNMVSISDCRIRSTGDTTEFNVELILWRVRGIPSEFFPTKAVAEQMARNTFPRDTMEASYARISYVTFHQET